MIKKAVIFIVAMLLTACAAQPVQSSSIAPEATVPSDISAPQPVQTVEPAQQLVLMAAGDNLIHDVIYNQAARRADGDGYDFAPLYAHVAPLLDEADFAFVNQETVLAGEQFAPSSYPLFCSPTQVGEALVGLGFNLFSTANNHSYDKGEAGLLAAADFWEAQQDIAVAGSYRNAEQRDIVHTVTRDGVTVALVAAAEQTNGLSLPADSQAGVVLLQDKERLLQQLDAAAKQADLVVLSLHWGNEDSDTPTAEQRTLAAELAEAGADLILGHHSHVLQGGEYIETARGRCYVAYSLGNFVSAQVRPQNLAGGLLRVELTKAAGQVTLGKVTFIPTITHYEGGFAGLTIYPMQEYTPAMAARHGVRRYDSSFDYNSIVRQLDGLSW